MASIECQSRVESTLELVRFDLRLLALVSFADFAWKCLPIVDRNGNLSVNSASFPMSTLQNVQIKASTDVDSKCFDSIISHCDYLYSVFSLIYCKIEYACITYTKSQEFQAIDTTMVR